VTNIDSTATAEQEHGHNPHLDLVIRATNGSLWTTDKFKNNDTVEEVVGKAVDHFVHEHVMTDGAYDLVIVVDGAAGDPLHPSDRLADLSLREGVVLALQPHEPQVDG
jgi:hypothetical protein